jgi:HSP20 family protein
MSANVEIKKNTQLESPNRERTLTPYAEIWNSEERTLLVLDIPGAEETSIQVDFQENELKIEAQPTQVGITSALAYKEFQMGKYFRKFNVQGSYDPTQAQASYKNGQLFISLQKKQPISIKIPVVSN